MRVPLNLFDRVVNKVSAQETDPINQARAKMLVYCLTSNFIFAAINAGIYFIQGPQLQFIRATTALILAIGMLIAVYKWRIWRELSHVACWLLTIVVWSNLLLFVQGVNIPTLQFVFLVAVFSFYVQGVKWGLFYSVLNLVPIIAYTVIDGQHYFSINIPPQIVSQPAFVYVITYNFFIIIFLHYHFFKTFNRNTIEITNAKNHLKSMNEVLQSAMAELEKTSKAKMDFLSTMSHELRTPLNGVIGLSNVMIMENPREDQKENLAILKFSAENLLSLINDILDLNKLESDKVEIEQHPFFLTDLLKNTTGSLRLNASIKDLDFQVEIDDQLNDKLIKSDPTRLTQVISNLINNAIKFTERGHVKLAAQVLDTRDTNLRVRFIIEDTGIGINKDKQKDIFEPFTQASKSTTRKFGGTGLGLAIVKKILLMFNSNIHIESSPGEGSRFWFEIDFKYSIQEARVQQEAVFKKENLEGLRVLVAEDNIVNVMVIKKILSQWSIKPVIAENGMLAVSYLNEDDFDIVLMDLHMPEMDGYQAAKQIRLLQNEAKAGIPIIALTASVSNAVDSKVIAAGMDGYLSKPFNPDHLYEKLVHFSNL